MMKGLEDSLISMMTRLPEIIDQTASILEEIGGLVREVRGRNISEKVAAAIDTADGLLATARHKLEQVDTRELSRNAAQTLDGVTAAVGSLNGILARVSLDQGLLASVERASQAVGDTLRDADGLGDRLMETLVSMQSAARSIRKFTEAIEQDPDMLLKGRSKERER
jgi:methyl-accepting chemotaxis protein